MNYGIKITEQETVSFGLFFLNMNVILPIRRSGYSDGKFGFQPLIAVSPLKWSKTLVLLNAIFRRTLLQ